MWIYAFHLIYVDNWNKIIDFNTFWHIIMMPINLVKCWKLLFFRLSIYFLLLCSQALSTSAVVSPLEKVTEELKEMQETVSSVQASLISSVSLIQGRQRYIKHFRSFFILIIRSIGAVWRKKLWNYRLETFKFWATAGRN